MSMLHLIHVTFQMRRITGGIRHNIEVDLAIAAEASGFYVIRQALPDDCGGSDEVFVGRGRGQMAAVLDWLGAVDRSLFYVPAWKKVEESKP